MYRGVVTLRCSTFQDNFLGEAVSGREGFVNDPLSRNQSGYRDLEITLEIDETRSDYGIKGH